MPRNPLPSLTYLGRSTPAPTTPDEAVLDRVPREPRISPFAGRPRDDRQHLRDGVRNVVALLRPGLGHGPGRRRSINPLRDRGDDATF
jgi:hypothetical protein